MPGASYAVNLNPGSSGEYWHIGSDPYACHIRTDGYRNSMPFKGKAWQIECGKWSGWPPQWVSPGVVRLVFNNNYTVSVYKDGQYLYKVGPLSICRFACTVLPTQRLFIPMYWGPDSVAVGITQFIRNENSLGYGEGVVYVRNMQTVAFPFYYRYNLTGACPYKLDVQITTAEKNITEADGWIYINMTYSGYLKLYLGDKLVAYDALYGWTIRREPAPPPPSPPGVPLPDGACVPQVVRKPKGIEHRNLQQGESGYSVEVVKKYEVREFGCGADRKYTETISAGVYTATGTSYHTKDPRNNVCGYQQARTCNGVVYCNQCPD